MNKSLLGEFEGIAARLKQELSEIQREAICMIIKVFNRLFAF